jgi:hypothetical protein
MWIIKEHQVRENTSDDNAKLTQGLSHISRRHQEYGSAFEKALKAHAFSQEYFRYTYTLSGGSRGGHCPCTANTS